MTLNNLIRVLPAEGRVMQADTTKFLAIGVNGQDRTVVAGLDLAGLLVQLGLDARKVAVERNEAIVPRSLCAQTPLAAGDRIEIVQFIGGG